ncbi:MAG: N-acetyl-gamma-glutamyl-phosphate reductase [Actinobacteria bacterium]|nr:MAG: N-acetyl-gamma-glutamyl-phosphate reductase [Actinomycetota bacterium]
MLRVGVIGATGYSGIEAVRLLASHPRAEPVYLTSTSEAGASVSRLYPALHSLNLRFEAFDASTAKERCDLFLLCLPHGESAPLAAQLLDEEHKVIDLSADLRLPQAEYEQWYELSHPAPELLKQAVYGLPELNRGEIESATLVANPGCYPTGALLALAPAVDAGLIDTSTIVIDSKSGVSGAGRAPAPGVHFCAVSDSLTAYKVGTHRHTPEIELSLSLLADAPVVVSFTPHLAPMSRGILTTVYATLPDGVDAGQLVEEYANFYAASSFVFIRSDGSVPSTGDVAGSNECHISLHVDERTNRLVCISAIDNLLKGASGQAIQNMNLMYGFAEVAGLELLGRTV